MRKEKGNELTLDQRYTIGHGVKHDKNDLLIRVFGMTGSWGPTNKMVH